MTRAAAEKLWKSKERRQRDEFFLSARMMTPFVAVEAGDELFFVSTADLGIARKLFVTRGRGDITRVATAARLLTELGLDPAGTTFVDVGANIGTTTVAALRRHSFSHGVALEPVSSTFMLLRLNLIANGIDAGVVPLQVAAADVVGEMMLGLSIGSGANVLVPEGQRTERETVPVAVTTLDALVERGVIEPSEVGLVWIDTPRIEHQVLAGASVLLRAGVPVVFVARGGKSEVWAERTSELTTLLHGYTDFADLQAKGSITVSTDLKGVLRSLTGRSTELLAVKRR